MDNNIKKPINVETLIGCGCFQSFIFLLCQWNSFLQGSNMLFMAFAKSAPSQWACMDGMDIYGNGTNFNETRQCAIISSPNGCENFTWSASFYSIVPHWQLVCDRIKYVYLIMMVQMLGAFFGSPVFGQMSDSFGRKWTLLTTISILIASGTASGFSPNWQIFAALRFICGFSAGGCIVVNHVFLMEFLIRKHRLWVTNTTGWSLSYMLLVALAYVTADWRKLAIVTNLCSIPSLFIVWWIGESPRWLIQKGKTAEAEKQLRRIARLNRHTLDEEDVAIVLRNGQPIITSAELSSETEKLSAPPTPVLGLVSNQPVPVNATKMYSYWHLFSTKSMGIYTVILSVTYFSISVISGGIVFNVDKLSGNIYANFAIMGGLRWASHLFVVAGDLFIKKYGRRIGLIVPLVLLCICSIGVTLTYIFASNYPELKTVILVVSMTMAMLSPPVWIMVYLSNTELFPTPIRNMAHAFCAIFNRLGGVAVPQILYLAHVWKPAPFAIFGGLSLIASILYGIFIPETKGRPLPEKMPETNSESASVLTHIPRRQKQAIDENVKHSYSLVADA